MRSIFTGAKKCAGAKPHKRAKPDCGFAEAEPPKGAKRKQSCYAIFDYPLAKSLPHNELSSALVFDTAFLVQQPKLPVANRSGIESPLGGFIAPPWKQHFSGEAFLSGERGLVGTGQRPGHEHLLREQGICIRARFARFYGG
jgi:hypothetical protein